MVLSVTASVTPQARHGSTGCAGNLCARGIHVLVVAALAAPATLSIIRNIFVDATDAASLPCVDFGEIPRRVRHWARLWVVYKALFRCSCSLIPLLILAPIMVPGRFEPQPGGCAEHPADYDRHDRRDSHSETGFDAVAISTVLPVLLCPVRRQLNREYSACWMCLFRLPCSPARYRKPHLHDGGRWLHLLRLQHRSWSSAAADAC